MILLCMSANGLTDFECYRQQPGWPFRTNYQYFSASHPKFEVKAGGGCTYTDMVKIRPELYESIFKLKGYLKQ